MFPCFLDGGMYYFASIIILKNGIPPRFSHTSHAELPVQPTSAAYSMPTAPIGAAKSHEVGQTNDISYV